MMHVQKANKYIKLSVSFYFHQYTYADRLKALHGVISFKCQLRTMSFSLIGHK